MHHRTMTFAQLPKHPLLLTMAGVIGDTSHRWLIRLIYRIWWFLYSLISNKSNIGNAWSRICAQLHAAYRRLVVKKCVFSPWHPVGFEFNIWNRYLDLHRRFTHPLLKTCTLPDQLGIGSYIFDIKRKISVLIINWRCIKTCIRNMCILLYF